MCQRHEMRVYFDACCLNRPFDDQTQDRIRLESEAVLLLMRRLKAEQWEWIGSEALNFEIRRIPDRIRRLRVQLLMTFVSQSVLVGETEERRAVELAETGFHPLDALHLACAESGDVDVFFTTDDKLLRLAQRVARQLQESPEPTHVVRREGREMSARTRTLEEIRLLGLAALERELGPVDMIRFLQRYETGDYSKDRQQWLDDQGVKAIAEEIRRARAKEMPDSDQPC
jgi:predicted nucleic acid-binding protein